MAQINLKSSAGMSPAPRTFGFLDGSSYDEFGNQINAPSVNPQAGLPKLNGKVSQPATPPAPTAANTSEDPITKFNLGLLEMLKKAQGFDQSKLYNERNRLALAQTNNSMASASQMGLEGMKPSDALAARGRAADLYNPEINNLTDRIQASVQAVNQFKQAVDAAKQYGEEIAKQIKPDQETINAVQEMLIAGQNPGQDVLNRVSKYIDWKKVGAAKQEGKTSSEKEYERAKAEGWKGTFQQWVDRSSQYKGDGTDKLTQSEKEGQYISDTRETFKQGKGVDNKINPDGYRQKMYEYERKGYGTIEDFKKKFPPEAWLDSNNLVDDLSNIEA